MFIVVMIIGDSNGFGDEVTTKMVLMVKVLLIALVI